MGKPSAMKTAYCTPVETGRKHIEDMFRKQPNIMKKRKHTKTRTQLKKTKPCLTEKTKSETSNPQETAHSK